MKLLHVAVPLALTSLFILGGCTTKAPQHTKSSNIMLKKSPTDETLHVDKKIKHSNVASKGIKSKSEDLKMYPQTLERYIDNLRPSLCMVDEKAFLHKYYEPWSYKKPPYNLKEILWPYSSYKADNAYGLNLQKLPQSWFDTLRANENYVDYGSLNRYGITKKQLNLRSFATDEPLFHDPSKAGEGFPFDYVQNSSIHTNEPIFVSHYSKDKKWIYIFTSYATGWVHSENISFIDSSDIKTLEDATPLYIVHDNVKMYDAHGRFITEADVGVIVPMIDEDSNGYSAKVMGIDGQFHIARISKHDASKHIRTMNKENVLDVGSEIIKSRYGWGGLFGERDCSSTMRDFFAPFGIWLPRNSFQQKDIGKKIDISNLTDKEKIARITKYGIAFKTLLYRRGHILLYMGTYQNKVMVLHNIWGIKTVDKNGEFGRYIIGRAIISTLYIGEELKNVDESNIMIHKITHMSILTE